MPTFVYQVSGEYSLLKNGIQKKILAENSIIETLISFKRSGATAIISYFAEDVCNKIKKNLL